MEVMIKKQGHVLVVLTRPRWISRLVVACITRYVGLDSITRLMGPVLLLMNYVMNSMLITEGVKLVLRIMRLMKEACVVCKGIIYMILVVRGF